MTSLPARDTLLAVVAGIAIGYCGNYCGGVSLGGWVWLVLAAILLVILFVCISSRNSQVFAATVLIFIATLAGLWHHTVSSQFDPRDIGFVATDASEPCCANAVVKTLPRARPAALRRSFSKEQLPYWSCVVDVQSVVSSGIAHEACGNLLVRWEADSTDLMPGDSVRLYGTLTKPRTTQNLGDYDLAAALRRERILATLDLTSHSGIVLTQRGDTSWRRILATCRRRVHDGFSQTMSPTAAAMASAMILGMRETLDDESRERLIETGTIHLLAISGLHIGLVAALVACGLTLLRVPPGGVAIAALAVCLAYFLMTDLRPPALRATVLVAVITLHVLSRRRVSAVNAISVTAIIVLIAHPNDLFELGAQLSFIATAVFLWQPESTLLKPRVARLFLISATIWLVLTPLIVSTIHVITPIAILVNPLLWIPMTLALFFGLCTLVAILVAPPLTMFFGSASSLGFDALLVIVQTAHSVPFGYGWFPGIPVWLLWAFYLPLAVATLFPALRPSRRVLIAALSMWLVTVAVTDIFSRVERRWSDRLEVNIGSVGHGLAITAIAPTGETLVVDVGSMSSPHRAANVVANQLWRAGRRRIDTLVISHGDYDHYGGVLALLERFAVGEVFMPPAMIDRNNTNSDLTQLYATLAKHNIPVRSVTAGDTLDGRFGAVRSIFLHPPPEDTLASENTNAQCLVLLLEHCGESVLLTGDIDTPELTWLERSTLNQDNPVAVMTVPHHGGRSASLAPLLTRAKPHTLVVSGGPRSVTANTLEDLTQRADSVHNVRLTHNCGGIDIHVTPHGVSVKSFLAIHPRGIRTPSPNAD